MPLFHVTTCLLCNPAKPQKFNCAALPEWNPDQPAPEAVVRYLTEIRNHLEKKHPEALRESAEVAGTIQLWILAKNFATSDPVVPLAADFRRRFIHRLTLPAGAQMLSNAWLEGVYRTMCEDSPTGTIRFEEFVRLRDMLLEEEGETVDPVTQILTTP